MRFSRDEALSVIETLGVAEALLEQIGWSNASLSALCASDSWRLQDARARLNFLIYGARLNEREPPTKIGLLRKSLLVACERSDTDHPDLLLGIAVQLHSEVAHRYGALQLEFEHEMLGLQVAGGYSVKVDSNFRQAELSDSGYPRLVKGLQHRLFGCLSRRETLEGLSHDNLSFVRRLCDDATLRLGYICGLIQNGGSLDLALAPLLRYYLTMDLACFSSFLEQMKVIVEFVESL